MTERELRKIRLKNDYEEMKKIRSDVIKWRVLKGEEPYAEVYEVTLNIRTIIGIQDGKPVYRDKSVVKIELPETYPFEQPHAYMVTMPQPFHPNWYVSGKWCFGFWDISESLMSYVYRMAKTVQFQPEYTNPQSPANHDALPWWFANEKSEYVPCDKQDIVFFNKEKKINIFSK
ncbi:MAG: hypothetical protein IJ583_00590 [Firmicutes bacterium]|nr:hypothetical protein [Bacillota bacterium]